ncbi:MAG: outer membrane beta-barrel protein [Pseudomonadota bacterium]
MTVLAGLCFSIMMLSTLIYAQDAGYIGVRGAFGLAHDVNRTVGERTASIDFNSTYGGSVLYGNEIMTWLRVEAEIGFLNTDVGNIQGHFDQETNASGQERFYTFMVNGLADYNNTTVFTPFAGIGVGAVYANHDIIFTPVSGSSAVESDDHDLTFGGQLMTGVKWEIYQDWSLDIMYRFVFVYDREHQQDFSPISDVSLEKTYLHNILLGICYAF